MNVKEQIDLNGKRVELLVQKTADGDYVAAANFKGGVSLAVFRDDDKDKARKVCLERLIEQESIMRKTDEEYINSLS